MKFIVRCFLWSLYSICANAQTIVIKDKKTNEPIVSASILIADIDSAIRTNLKGMASIAHLDQERRIRIKHWLYSDIELSYGDLEKMNFLIKMDQREKSLQEILINSSKWEQNRISSPSRIERISMKEMAFQNPQTSADLLGMSGYAFIQKSQLGGGSPMLRGMATNRVLLVIDDVRMNTAIFRAGNLQSVISLDANAMESTDIIFGPGSVMYGSDAIGGVMKFRTHTPQLFSSYDTQKMSISGNAITRLSSANNEKTAHLDLNIGFKKWALLSSYTYSDYGDLRSGSKGGVHYFFRPHSVLTIDNKDYMVPNADSTLQVGSQYSQFNMMHKFRYQANRFINLDYAFHFSETSPFNRYDRLYIMQTSGPYKNKLRWAEWYYGPQKWQMHRASIENTRSHKLFDQIKWVNAYQFFEESRFDREFMFRELRMQKENVHALSSNVDAEKKINEKISIQYGAEMIYNKVQSIASLTHVISKEVEPTVTRYPDGANWQSYGAYVSSSALLNPKWKLNASIRYNQFLIHSVFDTTYFPFPFTKSTMNHGALCGSIGSIYDIDPSWQLYANASTGFRAPNIDDMGKVFESVPGYLVVPNPGLRPEYVYNFEAGTLKTFGNSLKFDFTAYYTWMTDAMVRRNFTLNGDTTIRFLGNKSTIQAVQNVTNIQVYGFQTGVEFSHKGFVFKSNYSYQHGREQSADSLDYFPLRHAAPPFGSTHFRYEKKKFKADFYIVYNAKMDFKDLALTERINASYARDENGLPYVAAWHTFNFKAGYYPNQNIAITFGIENISDRMYRPYASGINAPGRNFIASLRTKF